MGKKEDALTSGYHANSRREEEGDVEEEDEEIYCGVGSCRPEFMQKWATIGCLTPALCLAGLSTSTLNMYINSQITTLERQFGFSSSVSGALLSCNDFGYLLTTLITSFLARRVHIPRALSMSTLFFGISGLLCTIPFFATRGDLPPVSGLASGGNFSSMAAGGRVVAGALCDLSAMGSNSTGLAATKDDSCGSGDGRQGPMAISADGKGLAIACIAIGMIFQGFGKSPRQPFIGTYIDDNVPKTKTTLYLGIVSAASIFGPVLAFTLGGLFSKLYLTLEDTEMSPMDPRWVGAWWLGFLTFGFLGVLAAIPTFFFPRRLKPQPHLRKLEEDRKREAKGRMCFHDLKEFLKSILRLVQTPVYMCVVMGTCVSLLGIGGMISFLPKYFETQFMIPTWQANILLGVLNILSAAGGTLVGGVVTSRFKLSPVQCLKLMVITTATSVIFNGMGFFLGCDQPYISMGASSGLPANGNTTEMTCGGTCQCDDTVFFPTCGADGVNYFSPCHAGCSESLGMSYGSCSCINATMTSWRKNSTGGQEEMTSQATPGFCAPDCSNLYPYAIVNFFGALTATLVIMPAFLVSVRSVKESDKPLAIGLSAFCGTLLGWFLGPIVYGRIVDSCCMLWSSGCDGGGSCSLYDLSVFRYRYHAIFFSTRIGCCLLYLTALLIAMYGRNKFAPQSDVIESTIAPEGEKLMLEKSLNGNGTRTSNGTPEEEEDDDFFGGKNIYKGKK
ncbi:solute carrier organic anion transporter family member 2A1-like [Littorina saxatilis]|uniref:Solute carrier organic anion transporter family member n=1 Tax=Littorina saxatilis TaxID=31220 RepID=A0AAN9ART7_9CAEN